MPSAAGGGGPAGSHGVEALPVQGNIYMLSGAGGNTTLQVGPTGVLIVDTQTAPLTERVLTAIRKLSSKPIRYVLNTSADLDHTGGNEGIAKAAGSPTTVVVINTPGETASQSVAILAHDNVLARMRTRPTAAWPSETYIDNEKEVYFNG